MHKSLKDQNYKRCSRQRRWMWSTSASASVDLPGAFPSATAAAPGVGIGIGIAAPWSSAIVCCTGSLPSRDDDSNSRFPPGDGAAHASTPPSAPPTLFVAALAGDAGNSPATADSAAGGGTATPTTSKNPSSSTRPACVVAPAPEPAGPPPTFASACPACLARLLLEGALAAPLPAESAGRLTAVMRPLARTSCSSSAYAALATCRSAARDTGSNSSESEGSSAPAAPDNRAWQCACATVTNTAPHKGKTGRAHTRGGGRGTRAHARDGWVDGSVRQSVMVQYRALAADRYAAREHRRRTVASFRCCETAAGRAANFRRQRRATCCRHCSLILGSIRQYTCLVICSPAIVICAGC